MAEILGIGCSHAPMILNPPEEWGNMRKSIYSRIPDYQAPPSMVKELADDNGLVHDRQNQRKIVDAFKVLRDKLHAWKPDVVIIVGDDQAENFKRDNLPTFCFYTGSEVEGYPFHRTLGKINLWDAPQDAKYSWQCDSTFAQDLVAFTIREGFDMASSTALKGWDFGLPHAHINPLTFLDPNGELTILPLFVNCYGEEAGEGYPPRPTARRCRTSSGTTCPPFASTPAPRSKVIPSTERWARSTSGTLPRMPNIPGSATAHSLKTWWPSPSAKGSTWLLPPRSRDGILGYPTPT